MPAMTTIPQPTTGQDRTLLGCIAALARDIKLSHSVFALPFALLATFLAANHRDHLPGPIELTLLVVCMVLARTMAMSVNRWADAGLDAQNPRTTKRAIPAGRLSRSFVLGAAIACFIGFALAAGGFWLVNGNPWPPMLSPLVAGWLALYSFTKRYTWLCHLFLGSSLALSPVAATIAIDPGFLGQPEPYLLFGMVLCWVSGFDVIYALQDVEVDRTQNLYSMPSRLGVDPALWISRLLHAISAACLVTLAVVSPPLSVFFDVAIGAVLILLVVEHALVWRSGTHHIDVVFFTLNGVISLLLGAAGIIDVLMTR